MSRGLPFLVLVFCSSLSLNTFGHGGGEASIEVGPQKGVIEVNQEKAFKLSPEAMKNFEVRSIPYSQGNVVVPKEAIVRTLKEAQIFRVRDGFLKAIDFKTVSKSEKSWTVRSTELRAKDEIATGGVGFLRIISSQLGEREQQEEDTNHGNAGHDESETGELHD